MRSILVAFETQIAQLPTKKKAAHVEYDSSAKKASRGCVKKLQPWVKKKKENKKEKKQEKKAHVLLPDVRLEPMILRLRLSCSMDCLSSNGIG